MPFIFGFVGILLLVAAVRGTQGDLFGLVAGDFTGKNNFLYWMAAILIVGWIGYLKPLKDFSTALLVLLGVVILLSNKGFFANVQAAIGTTATASAPVAVTGTVAASGAAATTTSGAPPAAPQAPALGSFSIA